jgi:hypothetical protein
MASALPGQTMGKAELYNEYLVRSQQKCGEFLYMLNNAKNHYLFSLIAEELKITVCFISSLYNIK